MLRDRPFVSALLARFTRKVALYYLTNNQFDAASYDQFVNKTRTAKVAAAVCDFAEENEVNFKNIRGWMLTNWRSLRAVVDAFDDVPLMPETNYNMAPASRGRKARRAAGPRYQEDAAFNADKELFEAELRGDVGPLVENTDEESTS